MLHVTFDGPYVTTASRNLAAGSLRLATGAAALQPLVRSAVTATATATATAHRSPDRPAYARTLRTPLGWHLHITERAAKS